MHKALILVLLLLFSGFTFAEKVEIEKKDYIKFIVSSYVNGFNEFDTSVTTFNDSVSIGIYYDLSTQKGELAKQLAKRFRFQVPKMLSSYEWAVDFR